VTDKSYGPYRPHKVHSLKTHVGCQYSAINSKLFTVILFYPPLYWTNKPQMIPISLWEILVLNRMCANAPQILVFFLNILPKLGDMQKYSTLCGSQIYPAVLIS